MAKFRSGKRKNGIVGLKIVVEKLQKSLPLGKRPDSEYDDVEEVIAESTYVPPDVKEGHFAVIAVLDGQEPKRFVVPLSFLSHPPFLRLLEEAAEEYGFDHEGAITIPCRPCELERILQAEQWQKERERDPTPTINNGVDWGSSITWLRAVRFHSFIDGIFFHVPVFSPLPCFMYYNLLLSLLQI